MVLDQQRIANNYKIIPVQYHQDKTKSKPARPENQNEYEEFIITDTPLDQKYINKILINDMVLDPEYSIKGRKILKILKDEYPEIYSTFEFMKF